MTGRSSKRLAVTDVLVLPPEPHTLVKIVRRCGFDVPVNSRAVVAPCPRRLRSPSSSRALAEDEVGTHLDQAGHPYLGKAGLVVASAVSDGRRRPRSPGCRRRQQVPSTASSRSPRQKQPGLASVPIGFAVVANSTRSGSEPRRWVMCSLASQAVALHPRPRSQHHQRLGPGDVARTPEAVDDLLRCSMSRPAPARARPGRRRS